jgi:hypothetical protein
MVRGADMVEGESEVDVGVFSQAPSSQTVLSEAKKDPCGLETDPFSETTAI